MAPRAYFVPFSKNEDAFTARENSAYFHSLCGEWDFSFFPDVEALGVEKSGFADKVKCADKIEVPMCWQMYTDRNYDPPQYINQDYPFPVDPPHLPDIIPCGFYRRKFDFNKKTDKAYHLNFEGVAPCFYLWINDSFVGFSSVSHNTSEFDVTNLLTNGENKIEVLVVKYCVGTYLEDQDFFRLSGIFRDVYILERDKAHIADIFVKPEISESLDKADVTVDICAVGDINLGWQLISPDNNIVCAGESDGTFDFSVDSPLLWNPEKPVLYKLIITCSNEIIALNLALRRFEIKNKTVLLNGVKVKALGINRHDSHPERGYAVPYEHFYNDLLILKRANVNTIRTSHYPNDPRFLELCDSVGFMVVDEADLETHGMGYNYGDWYWDYWAHITEVPEWREVCVDRAARLFERDKNHGCVIMWSLGNESGCGENHRAMREYIKNRDSGAIIHYENAHLEYAARLNKDFSDISDVESRMYAGVDYVKKYLADPESKKPFYYCEYVCSMSTGNVYQYWDKDFEESDLYFGACIWEYCDHAVNIGTPENPKYRFGGDWGETPNDYICCIDGLVYPDRTPRPGYYDMKKVYQPFGAEFADGILTIKNKRFYTDLSDTVINWAVKDFGKVVLNGTITDTDIPALATRDYKLFDSLEIGGNMTLDVTLNQKYDTEWAEAGYEIGLWQKILSRQSAYTCATNGDVHSSEDSLEVKISANNSVYTFNKNTGLLTSVVKNGKQMLAQPVGFEMWRTYQYCARDQLDTWARARYDKVEQKTYSSEVKHGKNEITFDTSISFAAAAMPPALRANVSYTVRGDGSLSIRVKSDVTGNAPELPRFGLKIVMPKGFENVDFYGFGPQESYADRYKATHLDMFSTSVSENYEHYIKPQECGSHYKTSYAKLADTQGNSLSFMSADPDGFCFNALHYTPKMLLETQHDDELCPLDETVVHLDYKIHASSTEFSDTEPDRVFAEKEFAFEYVIM